NSIPLPATDFLKYKIFGLSEKFDLHFICWDTNANRDAFYSKYHDRLPAKNIHMFYSKLDATTIVPLLLQNLSRLIFLPHISWPLLSRLAKNYGSDLKKIFTKFSLFYPVIAIRPDIIHFEYGTLARAFSDIKDYSRCKITSSFRGYDINYAGLEDKDYYNSVWLNFDGFHFLGNDLKRRAIKRGYQPGKTETLIPPGIDTVFFTPSGKAKPTDKLIIVSVGRLAWKKGYEYGLQAIAKLKTKGIPVEYRIIADGNYTQPILFAITELGLADEVKIIPARSPEEVKEHLDQAHVFLHPAISEGFSNAVLEAQAMQLPVVTTNADGLSENVEDGVTGFIVPLYDDIAMAEKLEWCFHNRERLQAIGNAGRQRVLEHFTIEKQLEKFAVFYTELCNDA
ncbi:MAG TPA: glycosyltransferase family 4 protein, partial [Flavipsychrobacter sp.]|nr:glycosyltransferase family 4 protein [Flavipsychrobacter sp.]